MSALWQANDRAFLGASARLKANNFDLLRLLFAAVVVLVHLYDLSGMPELDWIVGVVSSTVAVQAFFVVSGFLIFMSYERSSSLRSYAAKRLRRIYPAYATVVLLFACALVLASTLPAGAYYSATWLKYLAANLGFLNFLQSTLPGVFEGNRMPAVNGALWTLKIEVLFYCAVPVFVFLFRRFAYFPVMLGTYCLSVAYALAMAEMARRTGAGFYTELGRQLPGQLSYFIAGAALYYYLPLFERHIRAFLLGAGLIIALDMAYALPLLFPLALAVVVIYLALFIPLGNFGKYGDFSYGTYIVHFPIIQLFLHFGWMRDNPAGLIATLLLVVGVAAVLLWHLVEKRFLARTSHYVAAADTAAPAPAGAA
jgi:peptidoglycan/LPS O-acetylase OafA/YrhL